jgi:hypothetical protein
MSRLVKQILGEGDDSLRHGDIVKFKDKSHYHHDGYYKVDIDDAVGAKPEKPWIENMDGGGGWYIDSGELEVLARADEYDTDSLTHEDVDDIVDGSFDDDE